MRSKLAVSVPGRGRFVSQLQQICGL